jgi:hypothetical protein
MPEYLEYHKPQTHRRDWRWLWQVLAITFTVFYIICGPVGYESKPIPFWKEVARDDAPFLCAALLGTLNLIVSLRQPRDIAYILLAILNGIILIAVLIAMLWL